MAAAEVLSQHKLQSVTLCPKLYDPKSPKCYHFLSVLYKEGVYEKFCLLTNFSSYRNKKKTQLLSDSFLQFQNLKNENATLKQLLRKLQHLQDQEQEEDDVEKPSREEEEEVVVRGVQGSEAPRGEGEGRVRATVGGEKRGETMQREAGVGEEGLHVRRAGKGELCDKEMKIKRRGEAEGGQKELDKREKESEQKLENSTLTTSSEHLKPPSEDNPDATHLTVCSLSAPDLEPLTHRLQEAQEEADRQAGLAQDLRSKLVEQSRKTWEAEQKLVLVEAELQRLKRAAESLVEARRQVEVCLQTNKQNLLEIFKIFDAG